MFLDAVELLLVMYCSFVKVKIYTIKGYHTFYKMLVKKRRSKYLAKDLMNEEPFGFRVAQNLYTFQGLV